MLGEGRLAGAALDVLAEEPLQPDDRFLALPNVIVTPHIGGATADVTRHQSEIVVDAIERHLRGERPRWVANPAVLERRGLPRARRPRHARRRHPIGAPGRLRPRRPAGGGGPGGGPLPP